MVKILIGFLLALTTANAVADNVFIYEDTAQRASNAVSGGKMYIYKDTGGQVLLTNANPSGNFDTFTKKVKVTYYKDGTGSKASGMQNVSYGSNSNSASYSNSAYLSLR